MLTLLLTLSLQQSLGDSQYDIMFQMIHQACIYKFPNGDPTHEKIKAILDMYAPSTKLSDIIENFGLIEDYIRILSNIDRKLAGDQKDDGKFLKTLYNPMIVLMERLWPTPNFREAFYRIIDENIILGLQDLGMDADCLRKLVKLCKDILSKSKDSSLDSICRTYLNFDYAAFHKYLYDQIVKKRNFNLGIINDMFIENAKHAFGTPYAAISLMAEISNGILKPFVTMFNDPDLMNKFKGAADICQIPKLKEFLELASQGELNLSIIFNSTSPYENVTIIINDLIKPGGFRRFIKAISTEKEYESISAVLDIFSGKPLSQDAVKKVQESISFQTLEYLYNAVLFHLNPSFVLYPNGFKIDPNLKLSDLLDLLKVPGLSGELIIKDIRTTVNAIFDILSVTESAIGPFYNVTVPFFSVIRNVFNDFTEQDATIGSSMEAAFRLGKSYLEYYNACQNVKVVDTPKEFVDLEYIYREFYKNVNVPFDSAPRDFSEFYQKLISALHNNTQYIAINFLNSIKGSAFNDNFFTLLRQASDYNATFSYELLTSLVSGCGQYLLVNNTLKDIKERVDVIAVPLCSENGNIRELVKSIYRCDLAGIISSYTTMMNFVHGGKTSVKDLAAASKDLQESLEQAKKVHEEYNNDANIGPIPQPFQMPAWGIALICIGAVIVVGAIIAFIVVGIRKREKNGYLNSLL